MRLFDIEEWISELEDSSENQAEQEKRGQFKRSLRQHQAY